MLCRDAGQSCIDPDQHRLGGWKCVCNPPAVGVATTTAATCTIDECIVPSNHDTCSGAGQECSDPNPQNPNDWRCDCTDTAEFGVMTAATCTTSGWCAENGHICISAGQKCHEGACECIAPETGLPKEKAAAECVLDECVAVCATCADRGSGNLCTQEEQECVEGSLARSGDWMCKCYAPGTGTAPRALASCTIDECAGPGKVCITEEQQCEDLNTAATSTGDWRCVCHAPAVGKADGAVAECTLDECLIHSGVCTAEGQMCFDNDVAASKRGDWQCECVAPSTGTPVLGAPAACRQVGECEDNDVCSKNGQVCVDPTEAADDWECQCLPPSTGAHGRPAMCVLNECTSVCASCAQKPGGVHACLTNEQNCYDDNTEGWSVGDWKCVCPPPTKGEQTAGTATCKDDECARPGHAETCAGDMQECVDPDMDASNDWGCRCVAPYTGSTGLRSAAACGIDECAAPTESMQTGHDICTAAAQTCMDPHESIIGDWRCVCPYNGMSALAAPSLPCEPIGVCSDSVCAGAGQVCEEDGDSWRCVCAAPETGSAAGALAECRLDECDASCATCEGGACSAEGQTCTDPDTAAAATNDWVCTCPSGEGSKKGAPAACFVDECVANGGVCATEEQDCIDRDMRAASVGDWWCVCFAPRVGSAQAGKATCQNDECYTYGATCTAVGQECIDLNTAPSSVNDWMCQCAAPAVGAPSKAGVASCKYTGSCADPATAATCTDAGQKCIDADPADNTTTAAFRCACLAPAEGIPAAGAAATCTLDECTAICPTCAIPSQAAKGDVCVSSEQYCVDPDPTRRQDWTCNCYAPSATFAVMAPAASCTHDECTLAPLPPCESEGQTCFDPTPYPASLDDWQCQCPHGGSAVAQLAKCDEDECATVTDCAEAGQACFDADTAPDSKGDWVCRCLGTGEGEKKAGAATCTYPDGDECGLGVACGSGQYCTDPDPKSEVNYECRCAPPLHGTVGMAAPAQCSLNECTATCMTCAKKVAGSPDVCTVAGQTCTDPDTDAEGDWYCACDTPGMAPETNVMAPVARCVYDECVHIPNAMKCTEAGQDCVDDDQDAAGNWQCACRDPETGRGLRGAAACRRDECLDAANLAVCAGAEQVCYDADEATDGDWTCRCILPSVGAPATANEAECSLPEGHECSIAENADRCTAAGQRCEDPNHNVAGDWSCRCLPPAVTQLVKEDKVAVCGDVGCRAITKAEECNAIGSCHWDLGAASCFAGPGPAPLIGCNTTDRAVCDNYNECFYNETEGQCYLKTQGAGDVDDDDDGFCWWCVLLAVLALCCCCCIILALLYVRKRQDNGDVEDWTNNKKYEVGADALDEDEMMSPEEEGNTYGMKPNASSKSLLHSEIGGESIVSKGDVSKTSLGAPEDSNYL